MKMHQKRPHFKLETSEKIPAITSFAGTALLRQAMDKIGLIKEMKKLMIKKAGYGDDVVLEAIILLLAAGGRSFSDWEYLKGELGFEKMFGSCPAVDCLERYLRKLDITEPEPADCEGKVGYPLVLERLHKRMIVKAYKLAGKPKKLTLDIDSTLIETSKSEAHYSYDNTKAYHPINVYCPELRMVIVQEFRDGNVPAGHGYKGLIKRCKEILPGAHFTVRSDSAGYQNDQLDWMSRSRIRYYITADQSKSLKASLSADYNDWKPLIIDGVDTGQEVCELTYHSSAKSVKQQRFRFRTRKYIAIRKAKGQLDLFEGYKYQAIVTNAVWEDEERIVQNHRARCGTVEYANQQIKSQCGMDNLPSNNFSVNAAWYSLGCLTHNILRFIQEHLLPEKWKRFEIKTLRFILIRLAAVVIQKSRQVILRFYPGHPTFWAFDQAMHKVHSLPV
jgi:hypothetical protein